MVKQINHLFTYTQTITLKACQKTFVIFLYTESIEVTLVTTTSVLGRKLSLSVTL